MFYFKHIYLILLSMVCQAYTVCFAQAGNNHEIRVNGYYIVEYYGNSKVEQKNGVYYYPTDVKRRVMFLPNASNNMTKLNGILEEYKHRDLRKAYVDYNDFDVLDPKQGQDQYLSDTSWQAIEKELKKTKLIQHGGNEYQVLYVESFWARIKLVYAMRGIIPVYFDASIKESDYELVEIFFPTRLVKVDKAIVK